MKRTFSVFLLIIVLLVSCTKNKQPTESTIILENSMYVIVRLDSIHYLVSPNTTNGDGKPYILNIYDK